MKSSIQYNKTKDINININNDNINNDNIMTFNINLNINGFKKIYEYEKIFLFVKNINKSFKIIGKSDKLQKFKVNKIGNICNNDNNGQLTYSSSLCHRITPYEYNYIHKNNDNDKYTIQNSSLNIKDITDDWYYVPILESSSIETNNLTCDNGRDNKICEYFPNNGNNTYSSIEYNIIELDASDKKYLIDDKILIKELIDKSETNDKPRLIVINNSKLKKILDYEIFITNDETEFNNKSKTNINEMIDVNKCENNICNIKLNDTLIYGPIITDKYTIMDVVQLHNFFINNKLKPDTDMKCYSEKNVLGECYLTNKNIIGNKLSCKKIDNKVKCYDKKTNSDVLESFENDKREINSNVYLLGFIILIYVCLMSD